MPCVLGSVLCSDSLPVWRDPCVCVRSACLLGRAEVSQGSTAVWSSFLIATVLLLACAYVLYSSPSRSVVPYRGIFSLNLPVILRCCDQFAAETLTRVTKAPPNLNWANVPKSAFTISYGFQCNCGLQCGLMLSACPQHFARSAGGSLQLHFLHNHLFHAPASLPWAQSVSPHVLSRVMADLPGTGIPCISATISTRPGQANFGDQCCMWISTRVLHVARTGWPTLVPDIFIFVF